MNYSDTRATLCKSARQADGGRDGDSGRQDVGEHAMTESAYEASQRTIADMPNMDDAHLAEVRRNAAKQRKGWRRLCARQRAGPGDEAWEIMGAWCDVEAAAGAEQCVRIMKVEKEKQNGERE